MKQNKGLPILWPLLVAAFVVGTANLLKLRFETGDIYSEYSSLRPDPLGTKALYEGLDNLPGVSISRHYRPLNKLPEAAGTTLLLAGINVATTQYMPEPDVHALERFIAGGGRVVMALYPVPEMPQSMLRKNEAGQDSSDAKKRESDQRSRREFSIAVRWGFSVDFKPLPKGENGHHDATAIKGEFDADLPGSISWHSAVFFAKLGSEWKVLYTRDSLPVLIVREFGNGVLVLSADSYFLSNEAMRQERHPDLLAWLMGGNSRVVFDEMHLGTRDDPGVASLFRKYRLHGLVAGILLLAVLFVWNRSTSLVPRSVSGFSAANDPMAGKESAAGFVNLLRRSISRQNILDACFAEWKKSVAHGRADWSDRVARAESILREEKPLPAGERKPVEAYQAIARALNPRLRRGE